MNEEQTPGMEELETTTDLGQEQSPETMSDEEEIDNLSLNQDAEHGGVADTSIEDLEIKLIAEKDKYVRLVAEFTNYRRRVQQEISAARQGGQADLLRGFLEVLDDLERVSETDVKSTSVKTLVEGIGLVERKYQQELELAGVEGIDPVGEVFDPQFMEAMATVSTEISEEEGKVSEVFQKGYRLEDKLLRVARVSVFKVG
jgi:molecular chaperone GrpE